MKFRVPLFSFCLMLGALLPLFAQTHNVKQKGQTPVILSGMALSDYAPRRPATITGIVYLNAPAPAGGLDIRLSSENLQAAKVPPTLHIAPNALEGRFPIRLTDTFAVSAVTIFATLRKSRIELPIEFYKPIELRCVGTGSGKITLFWRGVPNAVGYNIYRSVKEKGKRKKLNAEPIKPRDPSPVLDDAYLYNDEGLKNKKEYFYVVVAVMPGNRETIRSEEQSDAPDPKGTPYDTEDAKKIILAIIKAGRKFDFD